jgi:uncharacterized protein (DUF1800 family)
MNRLIQIALILTAAALSLAATPDSGPMPWRQAGLSEEDAAIHLLNRFTFGARPGDVDTVVAMGLERWLDLQLSGSMPEPDLDARLSKIPILHMTSTAIAETYPNPGMVLRQARQAGVLPEDMDPADLADGRRRSVRRDIYRYAADQGYRPQRELMAALGEQKLIRAVYSSNQLTEMMTDFWFNHFNVSVTDGSTRSWILQYERDAIRPHALGTFRDLLGATARHPAMLLYLDNFMSVANPDSLTTLEWEADAVIRQVPNRNLRRGYQSKLDRFVDDSNRRRPGRANGINENYARELFELHTLGVDGGYTQQDIIEAARAFSGWTVFPPGAEGDRARLRLERVHRVGGLGFVVDGDFLFRADAHDAGPKNVLGTFIPSGGGISDGETVLDLVTTHPSTARHIATKLAVRFVSDAPSRELTDQLAATFLATGGDVPAVIRAMTRSDEFWHEALNPTKLKSPLEVATSSLRATQAGLTDSRELIEWVERMGEPLYRCPAPTGFPDTADGWLNTGTLLNRINFASELAHDSVGGVNVDLFSPDGLAALDPEVLSLRLLPGHDPVTVLAMVGSTQTNKSDQELVAALLGSPQFQRR